MDEAEFDRVTIEPGKMGGRPCIRGLRFTVAHLVRLVATGWSVQRIEEDYPYIEAADIREALLYAAKSSTRFP